MALSNLFGWTKKMEDTAAAACGTACGAGDKPAACGSACGAGDKPEVSTRPVDDCSERRQPTACGSACGAGDK